MTVRPDQHRRAFVAVRFFRLRNTNFQSPHQPIPLSSPAISDKLRPAHSAPAPNAFTNFIAHIPDAIPDLTGSYMRVTICNIMHVIAAKAILDYATEHKDASPWLMTFLERAEAARWTSIADVRRVYPHADAVKVRSGNDVIVFNARGNSYRLVTAIHFNRGKLYVLRFMTHPEYDKNRWKEHL